MDVPFCGVVEATSPKKGRGAPPVFGDVDAGHIYTLLSQ